VAGDPAMLAERVEEEISRDRNRAAVHGLDGVRVKLEVARATSASADAWRSGLPVSRLSSSASESRSRRISSAVLPKARARSTDVDRRQVSSNVRRAAWTA
jgi:hypothetical protein